MEFVTTDSDESESVNILAKDPYVATYSDFLTDEECQHFIEISRDSLKRALVSEDNKGVVSSGRTGSNTWIQHDHDEITKKVGERIANIVGIPLVNAEAFQVIYYGITQEYRQHYDSWLHDGSDKTLRCMKYGGARMKTALCYLNDVAKGGGTKMTKLDITVPAEKGKLLVFHNTVSDIDHTRHELSEHAGLPVEEGEKFAFNLWFKECNSRMLYKDFNPGYYSVDKETEKKELDKNEGEIKELDKNEGEIKTVSNVTLNVDNSERLHPSKDIFKISNYFTEEIKKSLISKCKFNTKSRRDAWVKNSDMSDLVNKIEKTTNVDKMFYENINVVEYKENDLHPNHFNAYDLESERGKKYTSVLGQRVFTLSLFLSDNIVVSFPSLKTSYHFNSGDFLIYNNVTDTTFNRDKDLSRTIVSLSGIGHVANIYVRGKSKSGEVLINDTYKDNLELEITEIENFGKTLNKVLDGFKNETIKRTWSGIDSFKYNFKGDFDRFTNYISQYNKIRSQGDVLNKDNLDQDYHLDDKLPIQVVNNVLNSELLDLLKEYYKETINKNVWALGDRQSNRYKAHNEPMSRFLHYECLPLIERITGKSLKPTYTYLSAYVKGADLPPHTDRPDCEYTVSFVVDKPDNFNWNIYVHKPQQEVKYKGRYDEKPPLEECEAVDCDAGGLMLFQGTDHIHFREELEADYYNVLLLHYCSV